MFLIKHYIRKTIPLIFWASGALVFFVFLWILGDIVWHGISSVSWDFFVELPRRAGRAGGISSILVSTFLLILVALFVSVPLGVGCAVFLSEYSRQSETLSKRIRQSLAILAAIPSIVFGLFGMVFFCLFLGWGWSILSGGMTLGCMVLPLIVHTTEEGLRSLPSMYRQGCEALSISKWTSLRKILLPAAFPGIMAGFILGVGRAVAETAAVMFTAGASLRMPQSLWDSGRSLAYHIYIMSMEVPGGTSRAYSSVLVLVLFLFVINTGSHYLATRFFKGRAL